MAIKSRLHLLRVHKDHENYASEYMKEGALLDSEKCRIYSCSSGFLVNLVAENPTDAQERFNNLLRPLVTTVGEIIFFAELRIPYQKVCLFLPSRYLQSMAQKCNFEYDENKTKKWVAAQANRMKNQVYREGTGKILDRVKRCGMWERVLGMEEAERK